MQRVVKVVRKIAVILVGVPVLIVGIVLIPIPGPGLLISLLGLLILSLEFDELKPFAERGKAQLRKLFAEARRKQDEINKKYKK